jgi:peptidoglycan/xylan/chitin deacetylase (PgdA/CDA1 family)
MVARAGARRGREGAGGSRRPRRRVRRLKRLVRRARRHALWAHGGRATFNVLGERVAQHPPLVERTLVEGHELGNHGFDHARLRHRPLETYRQLGRTTAAVREVAGATPRVFRPPYGSWSRSTVLAARTAGLVTVNWDVSPADWQTPGAEVIHRRVVENARPGSIVLLHDDRRALEQTAVALDGILRDLAERGYEFVTVSELLGLDPRG